MKDDKNEPMPGRGDRLLKVTRGQNERQKCVHTKGGTCQIHGEGAQLKWRPGKVNVVGSNGVNRLEYQRTYYFECDLGPERGG